ncbi:sigma-70 family RNA polymerase sigma factor [Pseudomonas aeruginosa]|uniref:sigma-70 family RNA polymerase sigma factor n=1 Tax=Pseudomonas aeruginosa TaxID=287 RepID=UPI001068C6FB|nr:sigma-70 family RNA polymerase sigma factor [Pseudomonas aeruginosa]TEQ87502.1 sigma-70 family RNA polymerase sigma factor [Pseudomonas aeruginosa]TEQ96034.1 sigma-70 family RNA polymerase sigma factor [Pseudomonas aeruginosa]
MGMDQTRNRLVGLMFQNDYSWLSGHLRRYLGCPHSAEDIASETFLKVLALPDPASIREPRALLTTIARRLMYDGWRRQDLERAYLESLAGLPEALAPSAEEQAQVVETLLRLERMLAGLSPKARAAFIHSQIGGLTYVEIAGLLEVSVSRIHQYMVEGFKQCYQVLAE